MSDMTSLEQALLALQQELESFRDLRPKLDEVKSKADAIVAEFKDQMISVEAHSRDTVREAKESYGDLSARNREQFEELKTAWDTELQLAQTQLKSFDQLLSEASSAFSEMASMATLVRDVGSMLNGLNLPSRMDKLDASVAGASAAVQSVQSRFDRLSDDVAVSMRNTTLETARMVEGATAKVLAAQDGASKAIAADCRSLRSSSRRAYVWIFS